jgi:PilZ domain
LDAIHFRQRAADAREMAKSGDDIRLSQMLLEVAVDLEAEAEAIEAAETEEPKSFSSPRPPTIDGAVLHTGGSDTDARPVQIVGLSAGGARVRIDQAPPPGSKVMLELPTHALHLDGTVLRVRGREAAIAFDVASGSDRD